MISKSLWREITGTIWLAGPVVAALLAQNSMSFIDTVMVGRLGSSSLAGIALGNTCYFFIFIICGGVVAAVGPMVSQAFGAGDYLAIGRVARQGLWLGLTLTIPAFFILWNIGPVLRWLGQEPANTELAQSYLRAVVWGFLPATWFMALRNVVEGISKPWPITIITFLGVGLNICLNYVLMFGKLGFPALGVVGTGIATSCVFWFMFVSLVLFIKKRRVFHSFGIFSQMGKPDPHYFKELFRIGWPIGIAHGVETGLFMTTALLMGVLGTTVLAAHQVALQCAAFSFMVPLGCGIATSVRVGQAVGRKDWEGVQLAGYSGVLIATTFMACTAVFFWTFPESIISIFLDTTEVANQPVIQLAARLLLIAAIFQVFDGIQVSAAGALRGLKDTRTPMLIGIFSYWAVGLTTGYFAGFVFDRGAVGLWWGLVLGLATAAVLLLLRFHLKSGTRQFVLEEPIPEGLPLNLS